MMHNILTLVAAAFVPLVVGAVWYNPNVFGKAVQSPGDTMKGGHRPMVYVGCVLLSFLLAVITITITIHQTHVGSIFQGDTTPEGLAAMQSFLAAYGDRFRTFKHGALHGTIAGVFFVLPVLGVHSMFEGKGFKYILVNVGYWTVCLALMGGIICQFLKLG